MSLVSLRMQDFRRYTLTEIELDQRLNLILGGNASGKTTILEAIHVLGTGKSFRSSKTESLVRYGANRFHVYGLVLKDVGIHTIKIAASGWDGGKEFYFDDHQHARISELARHLPVIVISPDSHFEFINKTKTRRAILDWALFHVEPSFHDVWNRYHRSLQQRNAALKDRRYGKASFSWDEEFSVLGEKIEAYRKSQCQDLNRVFVSISERLLGENHDAELVLTSGWEDKKGLLRCLSDDRERDMQRGVTHSGPHRNNLEIAKNGRSISNDASHGQNKLFFIALRLAQILHVRETTGKSCVTLIDDLPAELDSEHRARLTNYLATLPVQVVLTATEPGLVDTSVWPSSRKFHVEHGSISAHQIA